MTPATKWLFDLRTWRSLVIWLLWEHRYRHEACCSPTFSPLWFRTADYESWNCRIPLTEKSQIRCANFKSCWKTRLKFLSQMSHRISNRTFMACSWRNVVVSKRPPESTLRRLQSLLRLHFVTETTIIRRCKSTTEIRRSFAVINSTIMSKVLIWNDNWTCWCNFCPTRTEHSGQLLKVDKARLDSLFQKAFWERFCFSHIFYGRAYIRYW